MRRLEFEKSLEGLGRVHAAQEDTRIGVVAGRKLLQESCRPELQSKVESIFETAVHWKFGGTDKFECLPVDRGVWLVNVDGYYLGHLMAGPTLVDFAARLLDQGF